MTEVNIRYLQDNDKEKYFPVTHVDAVLGTSVEDWTKFNLDKPAMQNTAFKDGENGFDCSYKTLELFDLKVKSIRLNASNIKDGQLLTTLSDDLDLPLTPQSFYVRTPSTKQAGIVTLRPDGTLYFYNKDSNWTATDYVYSQYTWIE